MTERFSFDEATHRYYRGSIEIPAVTRCLDHSGLVSYDGIREDILEKKSRFGHSVHLATHYYDEGTLDFDSVPDDAKWRLEGWIKFREDTGFKPRRIECQHFATYNGMHYGMRIDREGFFNNDEAIIDIKTTVIIQPWVAIQLAGYALGLPEFDGRETSPISRFMKRRRVAVQLLDNGTYKKKDFEDKHDYSVFGSALHITTWKMNHSMSLKGL